MNLDSNINLDKGKVIKKKGRYVMVHVGEDMIAIPSDEFYTQVMDGKMEFKPDQLWLVKLIPSREGVNLAVMPLSEFPMGYHTLHLTSSAAVWYDLSDDSPVEKAILNQKSGLVTPA